MLEIREVGGMTESTGVRRTAVSGWLSIWSDPNLVTERLWGYGAMR